MMNQTNSTASPLPLKRLEYLDSLRGLAAGYVVLYHLTFLSPASAPKWLEPFIMQGGSGVMLFFVISAFSLFYTMPSHLKNEYPILSFYKHRFFRIVPLFYTWLLFYSLWFFVLREQPTSATSILSNIFMVFNLIPTQQEGIVLASWTIGVEVLFYISFPLLYSHIKNLKQAILFFILSILIYATTLKSIDLLPISTAIKENYKYWFITKDIPIFSLGFICYYAHFNHYQLALKNKKLIGIGLISLCFSIFMLHSNKFITDAVFFGNPYVWWGLAYIFLFMGVALYPIKTIVNRTTRFLGKISYSLYLSHCFVILVCGKLYQAISQYIENETLFYFTCAALTFAIAIPLSYTTYKFIEEPFIQLGRSTKKLIISPLPPTSLLALGNGSNIGKTLKS